MNQDTHNASLLCRVPSPHYGLLPCNHISIRLFPSISTWRFLHGFARRSVFSFAFSGRSPFPAGRLSFRVSGKGDGIVCALHSPHFSSPGSSLSTCVCVCVPSYFSSSFSSSSSSSRHESYVQGSHRSPFLHFFRPRHLHTKAIIKGKERTLINQRRVINATWRFPRFSGGNPDQRGREFDDRRDRLFLSFF